MLLSSDNKRKFKTIGYVSPVAFNFIALFVAGSWAPLVGGVIGATANILAENASKDELINQYEKCVDNALRKVRKTITRIDLIAILDGLANEVILYENLEDIIKKSDAYREYYCTPKDAKKIVRKFEFFFLKEVASCQQLNDFYTLNNTKFTLEKLKDIYDILNNNKEKIDAMSDEVSKIGKVFDKCEAIVKNFSQRIGNALIAFCGFIIFGLVFIGQYPQSLTIFLPIFFVISEIIVQNSYERFKYIICKKEMLTSITDTLLKALMQFLIVLALTYVSSKTFIILENEGLFIYTVKVAGGLLFEKLITYSKVGKQ